MKKIINTNIGLVIICLFCAVCVMADFIVIDKALDKYIEYCDEKNDVSNNNLILSEEDALKIGEELFLKVNQYYDETWFLSGYSFCDVNLNVGVDDVYSNVYRYNVSQKFDTVQTFKDYLSGFLSEGMIDKEFEVNNNHVLSYPEYKDIDGKLYCANFFESGWGTYYIKKYDINVSEILADKIIYNVTYYYCNDVVGNSVYTWDIEPCAEENVYSKTYEFVVEKNNTGNFVVSEFVYHEAPFKENKNFR